MTFNHEVTILGDGSQTPTTIVGDKLSKFDDLVAEATALKIKKPISEAKVASALT